VNTMQKLCKLETAILFVVSAVLVCLYTYWIHFRFALAHGDSAFLAQMVDRMAESGRPLSQVITAIDHLFAGFQPFIMTTPADELCALKLVGPGLGESNFFRWHTLFSLYLYLPVFMLLGGPLGLSLLTAVSYLTVIVGAYVLLRKSQVSILFSVLVAMLLVLHPVWSGGVLGDFYADRLFIGPAFVLCALLLTRRFDSRWVIPLAILVTLTSERTGVIVGALLIGSVVLADYRSPKEWWKHRSLLVTGILCAAFTVIVLTFFEHHSHYESYKESMKLENILNNLRNNPAFVAGLRTFIAINFIAWGLPALWFWRGLLLSVGLMIPNIIGNYGGAEKTGFLTHYHSLYFPVLAAAVCLSFVQLYKRYPRWASWAFVGWLGVAGLAYNLSSNQFDFDFTDVATRSLSYPFKGYKAEREVVAQRREMAAYMDQFPNTMVSTGEIFMPLLSRHHNIAYYPLGLEDADYVVIPRSGEPGFYAGAFSYLSAEELNKINRCLTRRLIDAGYRVQKEFPAGVVLSRK